jgi:hypothetical protein
MGKTTSVEECVAAIVDGIERRRRKVFVPREVAIVSALRALVLGPVGELATRLRARSAVPQLEAEAQRERWFGASSAGLGTNSARLEGGPVRRSG